ncbi:membrane protein [Mycolicibacterium cyprinidarum]|nr:membrane protein [Mycolicibacterium sp. NGTWS1803]
MRAHKTFARRMLLATVGAGAVLLGTSLPAQAQPDPPNCTTADLSGVMAGVDAATSAYLFTHPWVNDFLSSLEPLSPEDRQAAMTAYLQENPQVKTDYQGIRQPVMDFRNRCGGDTLDIRE